MLLRNSEKNPKEVPTSCFVGVPVEKYLPIDPLKRAVKLFFNRQPAIAKNQIGLQMIPDSSTQGDSHIKKTGMLVGNSEKNLKEVPRSCFVGVPVEKY